MSISTIIDQEDPRVQLVRELVEHVENFGLPPQQSFLCLVNAAGIIMALNMTNLAMMPDAVEEAKAIMLQAANAHLELNIGKPATSTVN